jgi:hypothetical protein
MTSVLFSNSATVAALANKTLAIGEKSLKIVDEAT